MTFKKAVKEMKEGREIYRPHWKTGVHLFIHDEKILIETSVNHEPNFWVADADDILADDWKSELSVALPF